MSRGGHNGLGSETQSQLLSPMEDMGGEPKVSTEGRMVERAVSGGKLSQAMRDGILLALGVP